MIISPIFNLFCRTRQEKDQTCILTRKSSFNNFTHRSFRSLYFIAKLILIRFIFFLEVVVWINSLFFFPSCWLDFNRWICWFFLTQDGERYAPWICSIIQRTFCFFWWSECGWYLKWGFGVTMAPFGEGEGGFWWRTFSLKIHVSFSLCEKLCW